VAAVDQITKIWAVDRLAGQPSVPVLGEFFKLTLVYNEGGAMGTSFGTSTWYLIIALIIIPILFYYLYIYRAALSFAIPLAFICGGAIGNLIDRFRLGRVVDFLDVDFFDINFLGFQLDRWWTFNIADAAISCALVFLLIKVLFFPPTKQPSDHISSPTTQPVE
jgi:signal peptidase II